MSTHNLCFEQKYENHQIFLSENSQLLEVKFSIYLNRRVFVMQDIQFLYAANKNCLLTGICCFCELADSICKQTHLQVYGNKLQFQMYFISFLHT